MKKRNRVYQVLVVFLLLLSFPVLCAVQYGEKEAAADSYYDYVIQGYHVDLQVTEENVYHITETIQAYFKQSRHGIYRNIPLVNQVKRQDGSEATVRAKVKNLHCAGENFEVSREGSDCQIKIGDEEKTVIGEKTYTIQYDYHMGKDVLDGADEFYYNIIGSGWSTTIENVSFSVRLPKEFDKTKLGFSYGEYGSSESSGITCEMEENSAFSGKLDSNIKLLPGDSLTVRLTLPEGYFVNEGEGYVVEKIAAAVAVLTAVLAFVFWWLFGRDDPVVEQVCFHPPYGLNPVELAYAYRGGLRSQDVVSLVVYLAQKGYIEIEEDSGKKSFTLRKKRDYQGTKQIEKMFLSGLFHKRNVVKKQDLEEKFYRTVADIIKKVDTKEEKRKLFYANSLNKGWIVVLLTIFAFVADIFWGAYEYYMEFIVAGLVSVLIVVCFTLLLYIATSAKTVLGGVLGAVASLAACVGVGIYVREFTSVWLYLIQAACCAISMFFVNYMYKRTPYGTDLLGKIQGFRNFLVTAEKDRLEALVSEEPEYFYEILPYTYVLDVSDKWMNKFETIAVAPPQWYANETGVSAFDVLYFNRFMERTMNQATSSMLSSPSDSSGGSGGGFSGGGSGGGGGGSW